MADSTETIRRDMVQVINSDPGSREALEAKYGKLWDTDELRRDFEVLSFAAPFIICNEKARGLKGSMMFQHHPRHYFNFEAI